MIDFNDERLVKRHEQWESVLIQFHVFLCDQRHQEGIIYDTQESAWAAFLKQEDESQ